MRYLWDIVIGAGAGWFIAWAQYRGKNAHSKRPR